MTTITPAVQQMAISKPFRVSVALMIGPASDKLTFDQWEELAATAINAFPGVVRETVRQKAVDFARRYAEQLANTDYPVHYIH